MIWDRLKMVNLKNAYYRRTNGFESPPVWEKYFTTGEHGLSDWQRVAAYLKAHRYTGAICLAHEYSDQAQILKFLKHDLAYARTLLDS